jgi:RNase H-fold protein (predicted Holliday junction resolvase)
MPGQHSEESPNDLVVLAVDPGRAKCGVAVVSSRGVLHREIVPAPDLSGRAAALLRRFAPACLVVGGGTGSGPILAALDACRGDVPLAAVDEAHTSELARARYLRENRPRGLRRLVPSFLRTPETPYDDYVAVILAERWLHSSEMQSGRKLPPGSLVL